MKRKDMGSLLHLQDYESSESEEEIKEVSPEKKKRLPLPNLPSYNSCRSITREPLSEDNEKKIRNFPHEPGNWATYVYVPITATNYIKDFITELLKLLQTPDLSAVDDFHISVTKTVILRHHWIQDFMHSINESLISIKPFFINLSGCKVYLNENKTRTFIGLEVAEGSKELNEIVQLLDKCLSNYNLPPFYKSPSFHMSILWCAGDKSNELKTHIDSLTKYIQNFNFYDKVFGLKCNSGNKMFNFDFASTGVR